MSNTLAINGGKPVFAENELNSLVPSWPIAYPETEQNRIDFFTSTKPPGGGLLTKSVNMQES